MRTQATISRGGFVVVVLALLAGLTSPVGGQEQRADPAECGAGLPANGSGYHPPSATTSLPTTHPRPGPDVLYWPLATSPQLENAGVWTAEPILISGASAYREGEFLYQDYLYDESGFDNGTSEGTETRPYPDEPEKYANNAADLVEVRLKPLSDALAIRITYNTMLDPQVAATTIALGDSPAALAMPHNAGAAMPAQVFVTVHGCSGDIVDAATGTELAIVPTVASDLQRRQVQVRVPYAAFDPRGNTAVRVGAATGVWDVSSNQYRRPTESAPAFLNVAFRFDEPVVVHDFRNTQQTDALASGDLSAFYAAVDFTKLARLVDDDMPDQPTGVPQTGSLNRIYASHFETRQGRGDITTTREVIVPGYTPCHAPCAPQFAGQLQPYAIYVPDRPEPESGWGLTLVHHGCNETINSFHDENPYSASRFADRDGGTAIAVLNQARGVCMWEFEQAGADLYEVWADVAHHYDLDPDRATLTGISLGGYATWKNVVQFPDLFARAAPFIGPPTASADWVGRPVPPQAGEGTVIYPLLASLRNVPVIHWVAIVDALVPFTATQPIPDLLNELGYRHSFGAFEGGHGSSLVASYDPMADYIANARVERDPQHVTYVYSEFMDQPEYGLTSNHAYWLSDITLRDSTATPLSTPLGTLDVFSHGFGVADAPAQEPVTTLGETTNASGEQIHYYTTTLEWGEAPAAPVADALDITATNVSAVTIDVDRARVSCDAAVNVDSDGPLEVTLVGTGCGRPEIVRVAGPTRIETAVAVSGLGAAPADTVVLARADEYADALVGGPLAVHLGAPLLLTDGTRLSDAVAAEIRRLDATEAVLLGGEQALSAQVASDVEALGLSVRRIAGPNRYATAAEIGAQMSYASEVLLASGDDFPDALSASSLGAGTGTPVLLTAPDRLSDETAGALSADVDVTVVGGPAAISDEVVADVDDRAAEVIRLAGDTRYATSAAVADEALARGVAASVVWLATGRNFPDALVAAAAAGRDGGVLLLVDGSDLDDSPETRDWLRARIDDIAVVRIAGGTAAVGSAVEQALAALR